MQDRIAAMESPLQCFNPPSAAAREHYRRRRTRRRVLRHAAAAPRYRMTLDPGIRGDGEAFDGHSPSGADARLELSGTEIDRRVSSTGTLWHSINGCP